MKKAIIEIIGDLNDITITGLKGRLANAKGEFDFFYPMESVENSNMLLVSHVSEEFIQAIGELIEQEVLSFSPTNVFVAAHDGGEVYTLPIVKSKKPRVYEKPHWLPLLLVKGKKFPSV